MRLLLFGYLKIPRCLRVHEPDDTTVPQHWVRAKKEKKEEREKKKVETDEMDDGGETPQFGQAQ